MWDFPPVMRLSRAQDRSVEVGRIYEEPEVMLKIELHAHTADDPVDRISHTSYNLIDRAYALGYNALAITLHERQFVDHRVSAYAAERGLILIPGIERTVERCHVLMLNFSTATEQVQSFDDLARLRQREAGLVIAPHPFFPAGTCLRSLLHRHAGLFDAVEWNAMFTRTLNFNRRAERFAKAQGKPMVGNCDVHRLYQLGSCYSMVDAAPEREAICDAIKQGRVSVSAEPLTAVRAAWTMADMELSRLLPRAGARMLRPVSDGA